MALTTYLAMTAAEMYYAQTLPEHPVWMACHFSSYATGLSNCPTSLPSGSLLMINDRIPIWNHDPALILTQLQHIENTITLDGIILDFQRPNCWRIQQITGILVKELSCPVAVSEHYVKNLDCPVFLSSPPLCTPLEKHFEKWQNHQIWLEAVLATEVLTITAQGCTRLEENLLFQDTLPFEAPNYFCKYGFDIADERAVFTLSRDREDLKKLLKYAEQLGIERAVGFYQQLS